MFLITLSCATALPCDTLKTQRCTEQNSELSFLKKFKASSSAALVEI